MARFGGRVVDAGIDHRILEVAGEVDQVERFLEILDPYGIAELARSGPVAMSRQGVPGHER